MRNYLWIFMLIGLGSCNTEPQPIAYGTDACTFCKMTIMDKRFGCQILNTKGKPFHFDDLSCLVGYLKTDIIPEKDIAHFYVPDYLGAHNLLDSKALTYVVSESFSSPMEGNVAAFSNKDSAMVYVTKMNGKLVEWNNILGHE